MTVNELIKNDDFKFLYLADGDREINGCYCGDLLSWVMGRAEENNAFVTIMTNVNVIAVASLINMSVVIFAENAAVSDEIVSAAITKGINLIKTPLSSYEACVSLSKLI